MLENASLAEITCRKDGKLIARYQASEKETSRLGDNGWTFLKEM